MPDAAWVGDPPIRLTRWVKKAPHPKQQAALLMSHIPEDKGGPVEELLFGGSAGGGKTALLLMAGLQYVDVPGYAALVLRKTYGELGGSAGIMTLAHEWLQGTDAKWNMQEYKWTFPSGATIRFGHLEHSESFYRYQGHEYQFLGWDELTTHKDDTAYRWLWRSLRKRDDGPLAEVPLRVWSTANPGGRGGRWVKARFIDKLPDQDDPMDVENANRRVFLPSFLHDNPSLNAEEYIHSLGFMEPQTRAQMLHGDWNAREPGDWYFEAEHLDAVESRGREMQRFYQNFEVRPELAHLGIDWGDHTHALLLWETEAGGVHVVRELYSIGDDLVSLTPKILRLNKERIPWGHARHDASAPKSISSFHTLAARASTEPAPKATGVAFGKWKGITAMHLRFLARRTAEGEPGGLSIGPECPVLLGQLRALESNPDDSKGAWLKDDDQHGADALIAGTAPYARRRREMFRNDRRLYAVEAA